MKNTSSALNAIESHERECKALYQSIEGAKRFDRLETMIWAVYPFILSVVVAAKYI